MMILSTLDPGVRAEQIEAAQTQLDSMNRIREAMQNQALRGEGSSADADAWDLKIRPLEEWMRVMKQADDEGSTP